MKAKVYLNVYNAHVMIFLCYLNVIDMKYRNFVSSPIFFFVSHNRENLKVKFEWNF